jgi:hypothetical protein
VDPTCKLGRGVYVWGSPDGFKFSLISGPHLSYSDTQAVLFFHNLLNKYVVYFRTHDRRPDLQECPGNTHSPAHRSIGQLLVSDLSAEDWGPGDRNQTKSVSVLNVDDQDPPCLDIYTSAAHAIADAVILHPMMCVLPFLYRNKQRY